LSAGLIIPKAFRAKVAPIISKLRQQRLKARQVSLDKIVENSAYLVKPPATVAPVRQRVVHVIANFMMGGSSRLVVDLIEYLGGEYNQRVITSFIPDPPAYVGLEIEECRFPLDEAPFLEYFQRTQPDFVHVHYWGDTDEPWYVKAIEAAGQLGLPVIENVNTPVTPYISDTVVRYVYVSDYVRHVFGQENSRHITIYPGSDFSHFDRDLHEKLPSDCVGMVYRLEEDKLNGQSIEPFIRIAQRRPQTRILIIGGGSLLAPFQKAVELAGVQECFEFTGYVRYEALPEFYRRMSVFIAPVWKESFGQVSSFAMNMRIPVIGYDIDAIGEIVDNTQLLAPPADADRLADIAINLLDSPELRESIGQQQATRVQEHFSIQAMNKSYAELYAEIGRTQKSPSS
ncbi:glycosyltransferase family 4 protein, partial [Methyloglobulus sp.]|uniref:glycosyltransferase family 4 protein n=1 Tax=Methyloglobulus sp. TaxID=2518622 RepID=UPI00398994F4